jgi:hypothetical protein
VVVVAAATTLFLQLFNWQSARNVTVLTLYVLKSSALKVGTSSDMSPTLAEGDY